MSKALPCSGKDFDCREDQRAEQYALLHVENPGHEVIELVLWELNWKEGVLEIHQKFKRLLKLN